MTGDSDYFAEGDWNVLCAQCGRKLKASRAVKNWQGTWRCPEHNEPRHPQDFVRAIRNEGQAAPFVQHPADIEARFCTVQTRRGVAGIGEAGCALPLGSADKTATLAGVAGTGQFAQTVSTTAVQTAAAPVTGSQGTGQTSSSLSVTGVASPVVSPGNVKGTSAVGSLTTTLSGGQPITGVLATSGVSPVTAFGETTIFANVMGVQASALLPPGAATDPDAFGNQISGGLYVKQGYTFNVGASSSPASSADKIGFDTRSPVFGSIVGSNFYGGAEIKAIYTSQVPMTIDGSTYNRQLVIVMAGTLPVNHFRDLTTYRTATPPGTSSFEHRITEIVNHTGGRFTQTGTETIWEFSVSNTFTNADFIPADLGTVGYIRFFKTKVATFTGLPFPPPP